MQQGGLDWELIAMIAAAASAAVIGWDWIASRGGNPRSDARKGLLEVAWPVFFIAADERLSDRPVVSVVSVFQSSVF